MVLHSKKFPPYRKWQSHIILKRKDKIIYFSYITEDHVTYYNRLEKYKSQHTNYLGLFYTVINPFPACSKILLMTFSKTFDVV